VVSWIVETTAGTGVGVVLGLPVAVGIEGFGFAAVLGPWPVCTRRRRENRQMQNSMVHCRNSNLGRPLI